MALIYLLTRRIAAARASTAFVLMFAFALLPLASTTGCKSTYYTAMRKLGKEKRDILVSRVKDAKKDQQETKEQIQTTMESFQALTGFQGGSLEKSYKRLNSEYEKAADQANKLHNRIQSIDQVSGDLFKEWQGEINSMGNAKLKAQSTTMLRNARAAGSLHALHAPDRRSSDAGSRRLSRSGALSEAQPQRARDRIAQGNIRFDRQRRHRPGAVDRRLDAGGRQTHRVAFDRRQSLSLLYPHMRAAHAANACHGAVVASGIRVSCTSTMNTLAHSVTRFTLRVDQ
jgi:hypothetical protein